MNHHSVAGCFGASDGNFALHPADEQRAFEWLTMLRKDEKSWKDAEKDLRDYMLKKGMRTERIEQQIARAEKMLKPWLVD